MKKIEALNDTIIVKPYEEEIENHSNIIVPDLGKESSKMAKVIAVGEGTWISGKFIPTQLKEGDIIILPPVNFVRFELEGEEYWSGSERYVLCRIKN